MKQRFLDGELLDYLDVDIRDGLHPGTKDSPAPDAEEVVFIEDVSGFGIGLSTGQS